MVQSAAHHGPRHLGEAEGGGQEVLHVRGHQPQQEGPGQSQAHGGRSQVKTCHIRMCVFLCLSNGQCLWVQIRIHFNWLLDRDLAA